MSRAPRVAFFESRADHFGRPFSDSIYAALLAAGFSIDVFAPDGDQPQEIYPATRVRRLGAEYRRRWLASQMIRSQWRSYDLFIGSADLPIAVAGTLAATWRRPTVFACDEIFVGGYLGDATGPWQRLARMAMRRARFTIIPDPARIPLQRECARLSDRHTFAQLPCSFLPLAHPPDRQQLRSALGIAPDDIVVSLTGALYPANGAPWAISLLRHPRLKLLIQPGGPPDATLHALLSHLAETDRVLYRPERLEYRAAMELTAAADIGLVVYLNAKPQFQHMGLSSQKLCNYLNLGIPVVASTQPSFSFIEETACGALVSSSEELPPVVDAIAAAWTDYSAAAQRAAQDYVRQADHVTALSERLRRLIGSETSLMYESAPAT
jgi:hypothetical protein